ncbi:MAG: UvrD-helicase domain-containing protein [Candidatus Obscuribacterales bacterium]|nr:UvrD-helicase domain-containing protein [Candidatus Obscuribacterales bacterium]
MTNSSKTNPNSGQAPADCREVLHWFVNNFGLYVGSPRGLFLSDWSDEQAVSLESAVVNLKSRGFNPLVINGETLYKQADYVFEEAKQNSSFGRPIVSKLELELTGNQLVIIEGLEAPERASHLWYLFNYVLFPRALAGKTNIFTTPLSYDEFVRYGKSCNDQDFWGRPINWEKLFWFIEATTISQDLFRQARESGVPPMLQAEYNLYKTLKERGVEMIPQHVLGDYLLDFALLDKERRLNVECDLISALAGHNMQINAAQRDFVLLSDGWQIVKFSCSELFNNASGCADVIEDIWRSGRKRSYFGRLQTGTTIPAISELPVEDAAQKQAISHGGGPISVLGGPGTGKTACLVQRVAYLHSQGISPETILVISYSADTARQVRSALEPILGKQESQRVNILSWHELGLKILRENLPAIKRKPPLKIEPSPQKILQRLLSKSKKDLDPLKLEMNGELDEFYIAAVISMYKAHLISAVQAKEEAQTSSEELIAKLYLAYEEQLQKANRVDRDDLYFLSVQALLENLEIRNKYQSAYEFVFIDECQEATVAQDMLARLLASPQDNIFFAGDEDETISEQKNACPDLLSENSIRYPYGLCVVLEKNWRCHPMIVEHARKLISGFTRRRVDKDLVSAWGQAPNTAISGPHALANEQDECAKVASEVKALVSSGRNAGEIAILYRNNLYEGLLEDELAKAGIAFRATHTDNSLVPDEVGDILAFLKLVNDPDGPKAREAFEKICQLGTKEIDPKLSATIASFADANTLSYLKGVEIYAEATADQSCRELEQLVKIIRAMNQDKLPASESISYLRRARRLNEYYKSAKVPPGVNYEPLKKLNQLEDEARKYGSVTDFVKYLESRSQSEDSSEDQVVHVKSVFDTKGREFPVVFLIGLAEGIFPPENSPDPEEERRIFYSAFTRAREALYLSYPRQVKNKNSRPSAFLTDLGLPMPGGAEPTAVVEPQLPPSSAPSLPPPPPTPAPVEAPAKKAFVPPPVVPPPVAPPAPVQQPEPEKQQPLYPDFTEPKPASMPQYVDRSASHGLRPYVGDVEQPPQRPQYLPPSKQAAPQPEPEQETTLSDFSPSQMAAAKAEAQSQESGRYFRINNMSAAALRALKQNGPYLNPLLFGHEQSLAEQGTVCPTCAEPVEINARFCGSCGQGLSLSQQQNCLVCSAALEANSKFCGECGTSVTTLTASPRQDKPGWMIKFLKLLEK